MGGTIWCADGSDGTCDPRAGLGLEVRGDG